MIYINFLYYKNCLLYIHYIRETHSGYINNLIYVSKTIYNNDRGT